MIFSRWITWWLVAGLWWTLEGFTSAVSYRRMGALADNPIPLEHALRTGLLSAWLWVPATVLAVWAADRFPLERGVWRRHVWVHLALAVAVCVARAGVVVALNPWVGWYRELPPFQEVLFTSVANNLFLFWFLVGFGHAVLYARRARQREEQLAYAELHALKMQLHPHFLFNTLNTISSFVRSEPLVAERMIARLSTMLRHALQHAGAHEVTLADEVRFVRSYLEIEQARFEDRLGVSWKIEEGVESARVPHLILQPLVENAVKHGIAPRARGGRVEIEARRCNGDLELLVRDDGVGMAGADGGDGVGLSNTRARLGQLYGSAYRLEVGSPPGGGVQVAVSFPYRTERSGATRPDPAGVLE